MPYIIHKMFAHLNLFILLLTHCLVLVGYLPGLFVLSNGLGASICFTSIFSSFCNFKRDIFPFFFGCGSSSSITVTTSGSTGFTSDAENILVN